MTCHSVSAHPENTQKLLFLKVPPTSTPILNRGCDSVITICIPNTISINPLTHHLRPIVFPQAFRKPQGALSGLNSRPLCLAISTNLRQPPPYLRADSDAPVLFLRPPSAHRRLRTAVNPLAMPANLAIGPLTVIRPSGASAESPRASCPRTCTAGRVQTAPLPEVIEFGPVVQKAKYGLLRRFLVVRADYRLLTEIKFVGHIRPSM